jgi:hypothetical protein
VSVGVGVGVSGPAVLAGLDHPDAWEALAAPVVFGPEVATRDVVAALGRAYVGRRDQVATRPRGQKGWVSEKRELLLADFEHHLGGGTLLGAYLLDAENRSGLVCLDVDAKDPALKADLLRPGDPSGASRGLLLKAALAAGVALARAFGQVPLVIYNGGKGAHAVLPMPDRFPAGAYRSEQRAALGAWDDLLAGMALTGLFAVDEFPRQSVTGGGLGNLLRLPFGRDPLTRRGSEVLCWDCPPGGWQGGNVISDPVALLVPDRDQARVADWTG